MDSYHNSRDFQLEKFLDEVPPRLREIFWEKIVDIKPRQLDEARAFVAGYPHPEKTGLFIQSKISGTGKSSLAICVVKDLIATNKTTAVSVFIPFIKLIDDLRTRIQRGEGMFDDPKVQRIMKSDVVIFDDVGVETLTRSVAQRYYALVDALWMYKKHVIMTSKFTVRELIARAEADVETELLESIASRIEGMCTILILDNDKDFRTGRRARPMRG